MNKCRVALLSALLASTGATAADDLELNIGGFVWGEVGFGDRYDNSDDDRLGVSKVALTLSPEYKNTRAVIVLGADGLFNEEHFSDGGASNNDAEFKEAFVGIKVDLAGGVFDTTMGKQPLLFGLKPNGWVGDRSIQSGYEFGGAGGVNISGQVQTAIIADWSWGGDGSGSAVSSIGSDGSWSIRFGLFDTDEDGPGDEASSITDNFILQIRGDNLFGTGLYGSAGYQQNYQEISDDEEGIISVGAGWNFGMFDLSLEYQGIDQAIVEEWNGLPLGTLDDDETVIIAEATFNLNEQWSFYADYATADEADVDTIRVGADFMYNEHMSFIIEYSDDSYATSASALDTDSIDLRAAFSF